MYTLYFDGSIRNSQVFAPGDCYQQKIDEPVGCSAAVIYNGGRRVFVKATTLVNQPMSNNVAEYHGLIVGLVWLLDKKQHEEKITVRGDSKMVIKQMFGHWKIKNGEYVENALFCRELVKNFTDISGEWIPRQKNSEADKVSKLYPKDVIQALPLNVQLLEVFQKQSSLL